ncbi:hypothetical protein CIW48_27360 [Methylobacterium sp. P1-11]|uniref:hypothetical protein n=1 Tax=Methylobacterium sp. P1-11 TaxID=2024616 RepID=UPI0011EC3620|nr:hypothetical protein [Methylobacterium sp. P1-11]KAA0117921.1 hypothetical protein CIW48_27360 [Methylobacterium sp. P1-11]
MASSPSTASPAGMELPDEIARAISDLETEAELYAGSFVDRDSVAKVRSALTTAILSRLSAAEAGREEACRERDQFRRSYNACIADMERGGTCKRVYSDAALGHALEETEAARDAALARMERLEKALGTILKPFPCVSGPPEDALEDLMAAVSRFRAAARSALSEAPSQGDR